MKNSEKLSRLVTDCYIYIMLLIYPLFWGFWGYTRLTDSKFVFFAAATGLWLILLAAAMIKEKARFRFTAAGSCALALLGLSAVSCALSPDIGAALLGSRYDGFVTIILCAAVFLGVSRFGKLKQSHIAALALSAGLCCAVALLQLWGCNALGLFPNGWTYYDSGYSYSGEFLGTLGNADVLSEFLCLVLPLFAVYHITGGMGLSRRCRVLPRLVLIPLFLGNYVVFAGDVSSGKLALALVSLIFAPFLLTGGKRLRRALDAAAAVCLALFFAKLALFSRDGETIRCTFAFSGVSLAALAGTLSAVILRFALRRFDFSPRSGRVFFSCLSAAAAVFALIYVYNYPGTSGGIYELSQVLRGDLDPDFGSKRLFIWREVMKLVRERPLFGGGPGTLADRLGLTFSRYVPETGINLSGTVDNAHNVYLGILANEGALALAAYLAVMSLTVYPAARAKKGPGPFLLPALVCCWIQEFFGLGLFIVTPVIWTVWGLCVSETGKGAGR